MSANFFKDLNIPLADYNLNVGSGNHGQQTAAMIAGINEILIKESPDCVLVFGDTNSTLAGAIATSKLCIPLIHIEAGLRSFNRIMPEEINRVATDHISDYLFAPTDIAMQNLSDENLSNRAYLTGDIMGDSLFDNIEKAEYRSAALSSLDIEPYHYYLLTLHRPYNVDNKFSLKKILTELSKLKSKILFSVHPRTLSQIKKYDYGLTENMILIEPLGYLDFIFLLKNSKKVITDSGGIQKEAYLLSKPCITLRTETEWIETVQAGWNLLVDPKEPGFARKIADFNPAGDPVPLFGHNVSKKMTAIIREIMK